MARCSGRWAALTNYHVLFRVWSDRTQRYMAVVRVCGVAARLGWAWRLAPAPMGGPHGAMQWARGGAY